MKNDTKKVVILIPIYRTFFDDFEIKSLKSVNQELKSFPIIFIVPQSLDIDFLKNYEIQFDYEIYRFEDQFFKSIDGYNQLLLSSHFYEAFLNYEFMLICQTDAYIFKNELTFWVSRKYDYIGAPWLDSEPTFLRDFSRSFNKIYRKLLNKKQRNFEHLNLVGNGGFSLRNIQKHYLISLEQQELINQHLKNRPESNYYIEDVFWSIQVPKLYPDFQIPEYKEALHFAVDRKPKRAFQLLENQFPFACHGFNKPKVFKFWKGKINELKNIKQ